MVVVAALYKFVSFPDPEDIIEQVRQWAAACEIRGTLLIATEGINGTVAGTRDGIDRMLAHLRSLPGLDGLEHKESFVDKQPFFRMKVKRKKEIVTLGVDGVDPSREVGRYVRPQDWNALISEPDVVLVDTRNDYEVDIGTFEGALNPQTASFREFPDWVKANLDPAKHKRVAMFCTGGIRCEKSTALLLKAGFEEVYHLQGGILKYFEETPAEDSKWRGECFVFDNRVAVNHQLQRGEHEFCPGCRGAVGPADRSSEKYVQDLCCPRCHDQLTDEQRARFEMRRKQRQQARQRGELG